MASFLILRKIMNKKITFILSFVLVLLILAVCQTSAAQPTLPTSTSVATDTNLSEEATPADAGLATVTPQPKESSSTPEAENKPDTVEAPVPTPDLRLDPADWRNWPVVPTISANALSIYQAGLEMGNDPTHFSKVGDCQNVVSYFLADFDKGRYRLGEDFADLQEVIDYYDGSWGRESLAVKGGFNVASVMNPIFADTELCEINETPLACEFRIHNPSVAIVSMETWWNHDDPTKYEFYMRKLLDEVIAQGILPVLATKADNLEGDHVINQAIAQLGYEYDIPVWNFWGASDPLPEHGLTEDGFHLTLGLGNYFDNPDNFAGAWPIRNLTALQTMDAVYDAIQTIEP